ncbi:SDR family oxidoreductase [Amycolatopsis sp. GM8]|uniref:SDR family oxidoreductase n=1 Tax=Amycolatopsis sp. GM8 TaxID=2896530 RepID=UPI001EEB73AB|nr:SDR family oxidoreductase [Amycolatopsis sp. GM8]
MGALDGRVAIITGAGRGIGREHARLFAQEGAKVVVNDLGATETGTGRDISPAQEVVDEIKAMGGDAVVNGDDVADYDGAKRLVQSAIDAFGTLDVLVNNAGILRDRTIVNMTEDEFDAVIRVHLRGHFLTLKCAAMYWRERSKAGERVQASVINTSSTSGLLSTGGQANYGAAKTGIATMTEIAQKELGRYGVRVNAIAPAAVTRLSATVPGFEERRERNRAEAAKTGFDKTDPANISPFVAYLATADCPIAGKTVFVRGGTVQLFRPYTVVDKITIDRRWTIGELAGATAKWGEITWSDEIDLG